MIDDLRHSPGGVGYRAIDLTGPWSAVAAAKTEAGGATPIVFQHGLGLDGRAWLPWMRRLAGAHPLVTIDMRGHGASAARWSAPSLEISDYAGDILDVLDHLGVERCHFVGESFGGTTGLWLGVHAPERIASIAVASTGWRGDLVNNVSEWPAILEAPGGLKLWTEMILDGSFDPAVDDPAIIAWAKAAHLAVKPEVVSALVLCLRAADLGPDLAKLTMPVLNLVAHRSPFVDLAQHAELRQRLPDYRQVDFHEAKHRLFLTRADACVDALLEMIG